MKSPAFQFYTKDWLSSRNVRMMTPEQRGWYIQLLCEAWESEDQGTLPDDEELLKKLAGASDPIATLWQPVMACFKRCDGVLLNQRLVNEKIKQENYAKHQSEAGKKGAQRRWNQRVKATLKQPHGNPIVSPMAKNSFASASAIASAIAYKEEGIENKKQTLNEKKTFKVPTALEVEDYLKTLSFVLDAQYFIDYQEARGWRLKTGPIKDWKAVIRTWQSNQKTKLQTTSQKQIRPSLEEYNKGIK